jgi:hypothetical protein
MNKESCENCRFWHESTANNDVGGICRINPPTVLWVGVPDRYVSVFPPMGKTGWCGHCAPKKGVENV